MKDRNTKSKKIAFIGLCSALALLLSYVEVLLPPLFVAVPGIKVGLPNIAIIYMLYCLGPKSAFLVSFVRLIINAMLFGNAMTLSYSVAGAVLSLTVMIILKKLDILSTVGVSIAGGICHNLGQVLVAMLLLDTAEIAYYMIVLTFTGIISGTVIGLAGYFLINRIPYNKIYRY